MPIVDAKDVFHITRKTLNYVDPRLVEHGGRVAYILCQMLRDQTMDPRRLADICILGVLHDVGAYKTDEIDRMVEFETENVWNHSIYGYLFVRDLSPLRSLADAILYHHVDYVLFDHFTSANWRLASLLKLADRVDILWQNGGDVKEEIGQKRRRQYGEANIHLFLQAEDRYQILAHLADGSYLKELETLFEQASLSMEEITGYLRMLAFSIDFRSEFTVAHTITTVNISMAIAKLLHFNAQQLDQVFIGSLLHDLGKIAMPLSILEKPGKLTSEEMGVMRTHVAITEDILRGYLDQESFLMAVRHHEKLNGAGYPRGLKAADLSLGQRAVAIADIISALHGRRSYKDSFGKEKILSILQQASQKGELCPQIVGLVTAHYDQIMGQARENGQPVLAAYANIKEEYQKLYEEYQFWGHQAGPAVVK